MSSSFEIDSWCLSNSLIVLWNYIYGFNWSSNFMPIDQPKKNFIAMKNLLLIFFLIPLIVAGQEAKDSFLNWQSVGDEINELRWMQVFEVTGDSKYLLDGVSRNLKTLPGYTFDVVNDNVILGAFRNVTIASQESVGNTPPILSQGKHTGSFKVQFKDNRYKVEVYNMETYADMGNALGVDLKGNIIWSDSFLFRRGKKKGKIKDSGMIALEGAFYHFINSFQITTVTLDDDF